jgi:hypothetical protein
MIYAGEVLYEINKDLRYQTDVYLSTGKRSMHGYETAAPSHQLHQSNAMICTSCLNKTTTYNLATCICILKPCGLSLSTKAKRVYSEKLTDTAKTVNIHNHTWSFHNRKDIKGHLYICRVDSP